VGTWPVNQLQTALPRTGPSKVRKRREADYQTRGKTRAGGTSTGCTLPSKIEKKKTLLELIPRRFDEKMQVNILKTRKRGDGRSRIWEAKEGARETSSQDLVRGED